MGQGEKGARDGDGSHTSASVCEVALQLWPVIVAWKSLQAVGCATVILQLPAREAERRYLGKALHMNKGVFRALKARVGGIGE